MSSAAKSVVDKLRHFDAYPKTLEDFQIKTVSGAAGNVYVYSCNLHYFNR